MHSDLSAFAYQRRSARVDTKEGSKSGDFMGRCPTGLSAKIVNQDRETGVLGVVMHGCDFRAFRGRRVDEIVRLQTRIEVALATINRGIK